MTRTLDGIMPLLEQAAAVWTEWNSKINVISRKDIENIREHHIMHSLAIAEYLRRFYPGEEPASILDIGTGGGFPGIPLAIAMPDTRFTLCDSVGKKLKVAAAVVEALGLTNVQIVNARAETLAGEWDWVVSRAVASLDDFYPWARGKYSRGILFLKGGDVNSEIAELLRSRHLDARKIRCWKVDNWLKDEYFEEKFVIEIGKNYLCTP